MHIAPLIKDLAVILSVAGLVTLIFHRIRQPVVLGYIAAGIIVGPHVPFTYVSDLPNVKIWAELGVIFLMFTLGLEFSFRRLTRIGSRAGLTGLFEVSAMMLLGWTAGMAMKLDKLECLFLAGAISISSTTIIVKAFEDLRVKLKRYAELVFAVLVVEDLMAVLILVFLTSLGTNEQLSGTDVLNVIARMIFLVGAWFIAGYFIVPRLVKTAGQMRSHELLIVVSTGLCLTMVAIASRYGYSAALGAFIMGSIIAETRESEYIAQLTLPLRDIFVAIFFVSVGMLIDPRILIQNWVTIIGISLLVMGGKLLFVTLGAVITGHDLKTAGKVGLSMAQIGEFSFIIAAAGVTLGAVNNRFYPIIVAVSLITTFLTPYLVKNSENLASKFEKSLPARVREILDEYARQLNLRASNRREKRMFLIHLVRWTANGIIMTTIFAFAARGLQPFLVKWTGNTVWSKSLAFGAALAASLPFLWTMISLFRQLKRRSTDQSDLSIIGIIFLMRILTVVWLGALMIEFISAYLSLLAIVGVVTLLFVLFYRNLEKSYAWLEQQFLSTFGQKTSSADHLAPWDARLVQMKIHPQSAVAGKTLLEARLREELGLNVVALQRGNHVTVSPQRHEILYPHDLLLVLGPDETLEKARDVLEGPQDENQISDNLQDFSLQSVTIGRDSPLAGQTILSSHIRQNGGLIVGIEREKSRTINPSSDFLIQEGDLLWVVGRGDMSDFLSAD